MAGISALQQAIIDYKSNNGVSKTDVANKIFETLNNNGNDVIDSGDRMSDSWKEIFGFKSDPSKQINKSKLESKIDELANYIVASDIEITEDLPPFNASSLKIADGTSYGEAIYGQLKGWSTDGNYKVATSYLNSVNKYNVIGVIEGFKAQSGDDGIMEYMDDEQGASELKGRVKVPKALCELAEEVGVTDCPAYKYVKSIVTDYVSKNGIESSKPFKNGHYGAKIGYAAAGGLVTGIAALGTAALVNAWNPAGWVLGGIAAAGAAIGGIAYCCQDDEAELLDAQMLVLVQAIKNKLGMSASAEVPTT